MDYDDAAPPPIRRASRSGPRQTLTLDLYEPLEDLHIQDSDSDDAAPPPIRLRKPGPTDSTRSKMSTKPPLPSKNPLRSRTVPSIPDPRSSDFSHPIRAPPQPRTAYSIPNRKPSRSISYRSNPRLPPSLRRCSSLETIDSVTTTASGDDEDIRDAPEYPGSEESTLPSPYFLDEVDSTLATPTSLADSFAKPSPLFSHQRIDSATTVPAIEHESPRRYEYSRVEHHYPVEDPQFYSHMYSIADEEVSSSPQVSLSSERSSDCSSDRTSAPTTSTSARPSVSATRSTSSVLRRLRPKKIREPLLTPQHLEIEKTVEFDQQSQRTSSLSSTMTISSGRPSELGAALPSSSTSQHSQSSREWKASSFDTTTLSEAELKKCKKKGINPALYAEMKAARKGKFISPIGGNTFL
jgi:hypothetical protein